MANTKIGFSVSPETKAELEKLLTFTSYEAAKYLGISKHTLYKLTAARLFPIAKPNNGKIYIRREDLDEYINKSFKDSKAQRNKKSTEYFLNAKN